MTKGNSHTIGTIEYELRVYNEKKAVKIQNEISELSRNEIPGVLEDLFDQIDQNGKYIVINRMEIDLGKFEFQDFKSNFSSVLQKTLSQKLNSLLISNQENPFNPKPEFKEENNFHLFEFFLKTGNLPWYAQGSGIDLVVVVKKLIRKKEPAFINLVLEHAHELNFQKRLSIIVPENYYKEMIALFTDRQVWKDDSPLKQLLTLFRILPFVDAGPSLFRQFLFQVIIETLASKKNHSNFDFEMDVFHKLALRLNISLGELITKINFSIKKLLLNKKYPLELMASIEFFLKYSETKISEFELKSKKTDQNIEKKDVDNTIKEENSYLIFNSGLILIYPFLNEFFAQSNLVKKNNFVNEETQHKAIHLLQYATFGRTGHPEYSLLLNKILCGFPIDKAIPWQVELSKKEKTQTTRMISATIKNWSALKNTSVASFRIAFLQRKGLLRKTENGWNLSIERTAYDVLLSRLPWQYEQIKLGWMTTTISTIW